ncbi:hypothetical protein GCM10023149_39610 [Mucilaginibacter gynuensis]|uniref:Uncharacterized protein n=1 Tax=Mucilaginibacter gynuensis TaxID=1302236 RepID=A0ABP8H1N5_9SPHI
MNTPVHISNTSTIRTPVSGGSSLLKNTTTYVVDALGEGLKQNFLGADINMEFLTLAIRVMASASIKTIQQKVIKPIAAKTRTAVKYPSLSQPAF